MIQINKSGAFKEKPLSDETLADFSLQLSSLLKAGIPLLKAFEIIIKNDHSNKPILKYYNSVADKIRSGVSFSDALRSLNGKFPDTMICLVSSAEHSGNLSRAMAKSYDYFNKQHAIKRKISSVSAYPKLIICILLFVILVLSVAVIPQFADVFSDYEDIPVTTEFLFSISSFIRNNLLFILFGIFLVFCLISIILKNKQVILIADKLKVMLPYIGSLNQTIYTARFTDTFSSLHSCGVSIISSLEAASRTIGNEYLESQFDKVIDRISFGASLSDSLILVDGFDGKLCDMLKIGEESGEIEEMLGFVSEKLNLDADTAITKLLKLIEPAVILLISFVILFVMLSVMIPLLDSYALLESSIGL
ncbi:MAG: type II secretion system F family protein [Ruminococcaceae bacterium]|nr:type II secretion system F family protein [Oscillospiraceae bacterium]